MKIIWFEEAWDDYTYWQSQDKKTTKRINQLVQDSRSNDTQYKVILPHSAISQRTQRHGEEEQRK